MITKQQLAESDYIADDRQIAQFNAALGTTPIAGAFLSGPAGSGKTFLAETLSTIENARQFFFQCFPGTREEDLLNKLLPDENTISGVSITPGPVLRATEHVKTHKTPTYLILDEWDKTRPSADSFLLDYLQYGRINFNKTAIKLTPAERTRLRVFITLNDERYLSEPLIRRLPMIYFHPLSAERIFQALTHTHSDDPLIGVAVKIYQAALQADLTKPVTVQELRQFIDAANSISGADFTDLVFQFITKNPHDHEKLAEVDLDDLKNISPPNIAKLEAVKFATEPQLAEESEWTPEMLPLVDLKNFTRLADTGNDRSADPMESEGIMELTREAYTVVTMVCGPPTDDPADLRVATICGKHIYFTKPLPLAQLPQFNPLFGTPGELMFHDPNPTLDDVCALRDDYGFEFSTYSQEEITAHRSGIDVKWTPEGTELIFRLQNLPDCVDEGIYDLRGGEGKCWYNSYGTGKIQLRTGIEEPEIEPTTDSNPVENIIRNQARLIDRTGGRAISTNSPNLAFKSVNRTVPTGKAQWNCIRKFALYLKDLVDSRDDVCYQLAKSTYDTNYTFKCLSTDNRTHVWFNLGGSWKAGLETASGIPYPTDDPEKVLEWIPQAIDKYLKGADK